jgi:hypothetical protein
MALTKLTANVANIIGLDDNPNEGATPLSSTELKNTFDKAGTDIKNYINNTLTEELDSKFETTSSDIGALSNLETEDKSSLVNAVNEVKGKNMITATASDTNVTTTTDSKYTNIVFNSVLSSVGNKLTLNTTTGEITVGSGISYVKVSCGCYITMNSSGTYHYLTIRKNGTQFGKNSQTKGQYSPSTYGITNLSNILIPVTQGDTISAQIFCRIAGSYTLGQGYISVEAL